MAKSTRRAVFKHGRPVAHTNSPFLLNRVAYLFFMPSFDIVSQVNSMEIENAVNQPRKELTTGSDFKETKAEFLLVKIEIRVWAEVQFNLGALTKIMMT